MQKIIKEPQRDIPVLAECEVLVVGGGPAGMAAALGAARAGADTLLVERYGFLGGNITVCAVEPPSWYRQEKTTMPGGVQKEIEERMIALNAAYPPTFKPSIGYNYDTEKFKAMADDLIQESGITPLYHCQGTVPYMQDGKVLGVVTESKSGRCAILAKRVVDCTGDGDIAARAGAPYELGDPTTHAIMGGTLKFFLRNVQEDKLEAAMDEDPLNRDPMAHKLFHKTYDKAKAAGEPPIPFANILMHYGLIGGGVINVNLATGDSTLDATDVRSLTRSEINLRRSVLRIIELYNKYGADEGLGDAKLLSFATAVGVRETRRFVAGYTLTKEDILNKARFDDTVGVFPVYMDGMGVVEIPFTDAYFHVPFRIIVPQKVNNLLVAGRCISCSREAIPTTRQMDFCMVTGQAAGVASALSIKQGKVSSAVDVASVQKELQHQGLRVF